MLKKDVHELIAELRRCHARAKDQAAFLALKQSELRPGDEISFFGYLQAKEQLYIEQSLLSGHAFMVQEVIQRKHINLDRDSRHILNELSKDSLLFN